MKEDARIYRVIILRLAIAFSHRSAKKIHSQNKLYISYLISVALSLAQQVSRSGANYELVVKLVGNNYPFWPLEK